MINASSSPTTSSASPAETDNSSSKTPSTQIRSRTDDVAIADDSIDFASLQLSHEILQGVADLGWLRPSPVQQKAIPIGKFGSDMIVQAKSGTGKTGVFAIIALEKINLGRGSPQVIILAPTREIAVQITDVINAIGKHLPGLSCQTFIGGLAIKSDLAALRRCHIIVGTPGRVAQLIEDRAFDLAGIRLFILDEADKLLDENFLPQVQWITSRLPKQQAHRPLQTLAFSATFTPKLIDTVKAMMVKNVQEVLLAPDTPSLKGVKQYYYLVPAEAAESSWKQWTAKVSKLLEIFSKISFYQCVVFTNDRPRAEVLKGKLNDEGWPTNFIAGGQTQQQRMGTMSALKDFQIRVLVSTDLTARGIDIERVNLVINLDMPAEPETYLHRVGRTGRFGSYGIAVSFVNTAELGVVERVCSLYQTTITPLPADIPREYYAYTLSNQDEQKSLKALEDKRQQAIANPPKSELVDPATLPKKKVVSKPEKSKSLKKTETKEKKLKEEEGDEEYEEEAEEFDDEDYYEDEDLEEGEEEYADEDEGDEDEEEEDADVPHANGTTDASRYASQLLWDQYYQQYCTQDVPAPYYGYSTPSYASYSYAYPAAPSPSPSYVPPPPPPPPVVPPSATAEQLQRIHHLYQAYYGLLCSYHQLLSAYQTNSHSQ